jgi:N-hydroxyarylamine O-acetyltransferase
VLNIKDYLERIKFPGSLLPDEATLKALHRHHLLTVPFENLDVHFKRPFDIKLKNVYDKVVNRNRGGFCYELNSLFNELLKSAGFKTKIISGRVITDKGQPGPQYDHMAILIRLDGKNLIADVGFGDLFIEPIEIKNDIQFDGRNYFRIDEEEDEFAIYMSPDKIHFHKKYTFTADETAIRLFEPPCFDKQVSPDSHFVKNTICTLLTDRGRITVYNDKFTETIGDQKTQKTVHGDDELRAILKTRFGIIITHD